MSPISNTVGAGSVRWLRRLIYVLSPYPRQQTCKDCWRPDGLDFHVPTPIWNEVTTVPVWPPMAREGFPGVLCLECFDRRAQVRGIDYSGELVIMGRHAWLADGIAATRLRERVGNAGATP